VVAASYLRAALADWTAHMYDAHRALHHLDVEHGAWIYRVFLLPSGLQVDLAFAPATDFRPLAATFRLVHGRAHEPLPAAAPIVVAGLIGYGWLYALHARSCIARGEPWQAIHMIAGVRDQALALACIRHGLPAAHAKGVDRLPRDVIAPFEDSLARSLEAVELSRAFRAAVGCL